MNEPRPSTAAPREPGPGSPDPRFSPEPPAPRDPGGGAAPRAPRPVPEPAPAPVPEPVPAPAPEPAAETAPERAPEPAPAPRLPAVTVIVPTRDEAENVGELLGRLDAAIPRDMPAEVLFVDDSRDSTPTVIRSLARYCRLRVSVHHRERPDGGLGGAVAEGLRRVTTPWIVVMDADLQHPAGLVPRLVLHGEREDAELVVASRYADGGSRAGLAGAYRTTVSRLATLVVKAAFPRALRSVSDPMSGFFAIRRRAVERPLGGSAERGGAGAALRPLGHKILLELAVRCRPRGVAELPYTFGERFAGRSKSTLREGLRFLRHVTALRTTTAGARLSACALIGLSGFAPNLLALKLLTEAAGTHYVAAGIAANQLALLWNFLLTDRLLYANGPEPGPGGLRTGEPRTGRRRAGRQRWRRAGRRRAGRQGWRRAGRRRAGRQGWRRAGRRRTGELRTRELRSGALRFAPRRPGGRGRHRRPGTRPLPWPVRLLGFAAIANADLLLRLPLTVFLVSGASLAPVPATALALVPAFLLRFLLIERVLYRRAATISPRRGAPEFDHEADQTGKNERT